MTPDSPSTPAAQSPSADDRQALPPGVRFGELEIQRTLGIGGFGIVYLARDHALERDVAIKEFMPAQLAWRGADAMVSVRAGSQAATFEAGRRSFVNEARLLARFDHSSLLKVFRYWEANGTAYMAMPYLQGQTLRKARKALSEPPAEAWIRARLMPLLDALALLHSEGVYHRDIAPDNIWLSGSEGAPVLLDFGAARREIGDRTQSFTAILKPSYAPIEQYAESNALRQGPWTDLYALGAVLYFLLLGDAPPPATARVVADECQPLAQREGLRAAYSLELLSAIDWALAVRPKERPASVADFRAVLLGEHPAPEPLHPWTPPVPGLPQSLRPTSPKEAAASEFAPTLMVNAGGERTELLRPDTEAATVLLQDTQAESPRTVLLPLPPLPAPAAGQAVQPAQPRPALRTPAQPGPAPVPRAWLLPLLALAAGLLMLWTLARVLHRDPPAGVEVVPLVAAEAASSVEAMANPAAPPASAEPSPQASSAPVPGITLPALVSRPVAPAPARAPPPSAAASSVLEGARPVARSPVQAAPPPRVQESPAPAPAVAASAADADGGDPLQACAGRSLLARDWCIARRCERPAYAEHAECKRLQELREQRRLERQRN